MIKNLQLSVLLILLASGTTMAQGWVKVEGLDLNTDNQEWYDNQAGLLNTVLQTGELKNTSRKAQRSHPYYKSTFWVLGEVNYRGQNFKKIPLLYDIEADQLVTRNSGDLRYSSQPIQLNKTQISSFTIGETRFEFLTEKIELFENSFFEIMYRSQSMELLAKRLKQVEIESDGVDSYKELNRYYIRINGQVHRIYRKSSIIRQFPQHKKEIRAFIRKNRIEILKPDTDEQLKTLIKYCDELTAKWFEY